MIKTITSKLVSTTVLAGAVFAASTASAAWTGWNIHTEDYPVSKAMEFFIKEANERTDGRVSGRVYHGAVLGNQADAIAQMQIGSIDFAGFNLGPLGAYVPEVNVVSLPFVFKDVEHMHRAMDGKVGEALSAAMSETGIMSLSWFDGGARSFYNTSKPINTPDDVKGMKFRVMNNELYVGMVEALGGNGTPMAYSEVYQGLKTGVIDGAENNWPSYDSSNHFEVSQYYSDTQHLILPECLCVSTAAWASLSDADKAVVKEVAKEASTLQRKLWAEREEKSREKVLASGVKYNAIENKAPFQAAMDVVYKDAVKANPSLQALIDQIKSVQ
ncbi:MAG: TRAP transporter substrate-binding protein [Pontibacterium sp.]